MLNGDKIIGRLSESEKSTQHLSKLKRKEKIWKQFTWTVARYSKKRKRTKKVNKVYTKLCCDDICESTLKR